MRGQVIGFSMQTHGSVRPCQDTLPLRGANSHVIEYKQNKTGDKRTATVSPKKYQKHQKRQKSQKPISLSVGEGA